MIKLLSKKDAHLLARLIKLSFDQELFKTKQTKVNEALSKVIGYNSYNALISNIPCKIHIRGDQSSEFAKFMSIEHRDQMVPSEWLKEKITLIGERGGNGSEFSLPDFIFPSKICKEWALDFKATGEKVMSGALLRIANEIDNESPKISGKDAEVVIGYCEEILGQRKAIKISMLDVIFEGQATNDAAGEIEREATRLLIALQSLL